VLFTKAEIEEGLFALVDELVASGVTSAIYVVGGAAIMLHVERGALTNDVDVLYSSAEIRASVRSVGAAKRWPETWLNDAAKMWASHYDGDDDWEIRFTRGDVSVRVAQPLLLLAMKLLAGRGQRDAMASTRYWRSGESGRSMMPRRCSTSTTRPRESRPGRYASFTSDLTAPKISEKRGLRRNQSQFAGFVETKDATKVFVS
jgi:hypothetical protein